MPVAVARSFKSRFNCKLTHIMSQCSLTAHNVLPLHPSGDGQSFPLLPVIKNEA